MGKKSRTKGVAYEREIAHLFRLLGFEDAKRHLEFQADEADAGRDLDGTFPFAVQCKCWGKTPSISAIEQIKADSQYPLPIAFLKRTQSKGTKSLEVVVMPVCVFNALVREILNLYDSYESDRSDSSWNSLLDEYDMNESIS
jgi:hypothetical protein